MASFGVDPVARGVAGAVVLAALVFDRRRTLLVAALGFGCASGLRVQGPLDLERFDPSDLVPVAVQLEEPIHDGRARGWVRLPGGEIVRARVTGLEEEAGGGGTRIVGRARLRDLGRRPTPDRRDPGRSAAANLDRVGVAFREAHVLSREPVGVRVRWAEWLDDRLGASSGFWRALSVADGGALHPGARERVQRLGLAHLLALSGMHTAIVAAALLWPWRRQGRRALAWVLPVLIAWAVFAGAGPSLVRAVGMAIWWVIARARGRRSDVSDGLAAVALGEMAVRPQLLFGIGWWLSYSATLAVIRSADGVRNWPRGVAAIAVSGAAQLATLPWVIDAFGYTSVAAPLTLLVAGPVFAAVLTVGLAGLSLAVLLPVLVPWTDATTIAAGHLFGYLLRLLQPTAVWTVEGAGFDGLAWAAILLAVAVGLWPARWRRRDRLVVVSFLGVLALLAPGSTHEWVLFDVGQGDAGVLRCGRTALVIDTGPHYGEVAPATWTVVDWLRRRNVERAEVLVTHGHLDHSGGLGALLASGLVAGVVVAEADAGESWVERVKEACRRSGASMRFVGRDDSLRVGHCRIEVLWPPGDAGDLHTNDRSLVLSWALGGGRALSAGDLERAGERGLGRPGRHEWLKVAHHGGDTGTDAAFLESLRPEHAFVCCGAGNRYGHPARAVLERLEASGVRVHRTDRCGFLRIRWNEGEGRAEFDCGRTGCP
jgi:competence protein ComEC